MQNDEYYTCLTCGANLDIGEECEDCRKIYDNVFVETRLSDYENDDGEGGDTFENYNYR